MEGSESQAIPGSALQVLPVENMGLYWVSHLLVFSDIGKYPWERGRSGPHWEPLGYREAKFTLTVGGHMTQINQPEHPTPLSPALD